jgi:surfactin synthase thioesterase subunit
VRHLVASGISAPSILPSPRVMELSKLEGRAFAEALAFFGGLPPELVHDEELHELLLPSLIGDFRMAAGYTYRAGEPLSVDITLVNGLQDPHVGERQLAAWRDECRAAPAYRWCEGDHFYFEDHPEFVVQVLLDVIRSDQHVELI